MTINYIYFLLSRLFKPVVHAFNLHSLIPTSMSNVSTSMSSNVSASTQSHVEMSLDAMVNSVPNSSSVNAFMRSNDIDDNEITSRFVPSLSCASSCASNSVYGSISVTTDDDDEVTSRLVPSLPK